MDFSSLLRGMMQGLLGPASKQRKPGQGGLFDKFLGGGDGWERLRPGIDPAQPLDSENMDEPHLGAFEQDYFEGEEVPIPRTPRTRAMEAFSRGGAGGFLEGGGRSPESDRNALYLKQRLLQRLMRSRGGLQYGPMR